MNRSTHSVLRSSAATLFLVALSTSAAAAAPPKFRALGHLPRGGAFSRPTAVSQDGLVVVGYGLGDGQYQAWIWTGASGMRVISAPNATGGFTAAWGTSANGSIVVGSTQTPTGEHAFRWTVTNGVQPLDPLTEAPFDCAAYGVSPDGHTIVGMSQSADGRVAVRWNGTTPTSLGDLPGGDTDGAALAACADASVIIGRGSTSSTGLSEAFRFDHNAMHPLGYLSGEGSSSAATAISNDGAVIVGGSDNGPNYEAFRWNAKDGMVGLGFVGIEPSYSNALAISGDGQVIVGESQAQAFIWTTAGGIKNLRTLLVDAGASEAATWQLLAATGVSLNGQTIVGYGLSPDGDTQGWIVQFHAVCPGDFDNSGITDIADIHAFLNAWFAGSPLADVNRSGGLPTVQDIFDFIAAWLSDCD